MREYLETYDLPSFRDADLETVTGVPAKFAIPLATEEPILPENCQPYRITGRVRHRIQQVLPHYVYSGTDSGERPGYVAAKLEYVNEEGALVEAYKEGGVEVFEGRFCPKATKREVLEYLKRLLHGYPEDLVPVNKFWLDQKIEFSEENGCKFKVIGVTKPTKTRKCYIYFRRWRTDSKSWGLIGYLLPQSAVPHRISDEISVSRQTFFKVLKKKFGITPEMIENTEERR